MSDSREIDLTLLQRALELAQRGVGHVEPNPAVGAVVADDLGRILGEGWHQQFGGPHAEVNAFAAAGDSARGATLYVTLEPCCHFGKTPPCTRAVIAAGIRRVVIATPDPAAHVAGKGIDELVAAGIQVEVGLLQDQAKRLIAPFTRLMTTGLPWVHAKWAMTLDGKIATRTGSSQWISNATSRAVVHQLRGRMDAIVTGIGTVLADDPLLTARPAGPRQAIRVVLDSTCRTPLTSKLVQTARDVPVLIVMSPTAPADRIAALQDAGVEVMAMPMSFTGKPDLLELAREFGRRRLTNVLIEAGGQVLGSFFDQRLINEVHSFIAPTLAGGNAAPSPLAGNGIDLMTQAERLVQPEVQVLDGDVYVHGVVQPASNDDQAGSTM